MPASEDLKKAFDSGTTNSTMVSLNRELASEFVDFIKDESTLLKKANVVKMKKPIVEIGKMYAPGRFLKPGVAGVKLSQSDYQQFNGQLVTLTSQLVRGAFLVTDEELQDNAEGQGVGEHMMKLVAKKVSNETERAMLYGRKLLSGTPLTIDQLFDGVITRSIASGNVVDANSLVLFSDRLVNKDKMVKAYKVTPTRIRNDLEYFMPSDVWCDYQNSFDANFNRDVLIKDIMGRPVNQVALMNTMNPVLVTAGASTTASASAAAGALTFTVASATGITAGKYLVLASGTANEQVVLVASVSSNTITATQVLIYPLASGDTVKEVTADGADTLLTYPKNLVVGIQTEGDGISFERERVESVGFIWHYKSRMDITMLEATDSVVVRNLKIK